MHDHALEASCKVGCTVIVSGLRWHCPSFAHRSPGAGLGVSAVCRQGLGPRGVQSLGFRRHRSFISVDKGFIRFELYQFYTVYDVWLRKFQALSCLSLLSLFGLVIVEIHQTSREPDSR